MSSVDSFGYTAEQQLIQNAGIQQVVMGGAMRVLARAGTGKTTCLLGLVLKMKQHPDWQTNICYVTFSKQNEKEFGHRVYQLLGHYQVMCFGVHVHTMNAICLRWYLGYTNAKYVAISNDIEHKSVDSLLNLRALVNDRHGNDSRWSQSRIQKEIMILSKVILKTLDNFLNSKESRVDASHVHYAVLPGHRFDNWAQKLDASVSSSSSNSSNSNSNKLPLQAAVDFYSRVDWVALAQRVFNDSATLPTTAAAVSDAAASSGSSSSSGGSSSNISSNISSGCSSSNVIPLTHSVYQKIVQLKKGKLTTTATATTDADISVFLVDEAQDLNDCQYDILRQQLQYGAAVVFVGDPAQSIFQFRGASRQFERCNVQSEQTLTQSFRFGNNIARISNVMLCLEKMWLELCLDRRRPPLKPNANSMATTAVTSSTTTSSLAATTTTAAPAAVTSIKDSLRPAALTCFSALSPLEAPVRGLPTVTDRIIPIGERLSYPYTILCRTNNGTYHELLASILEAIDRDREFTQQQFVSDRSGTNSAVHVSGSGCGDHDVAEGKLDDSTIAAVQYPFHNHNSIGSKSQLDPPLSQLQPQSHPQSQQSNLNGSPPVVAQKETNALVRSICDCSKRTTRRFFILGITSYAAFDQRLMKKIEQLQMISVRHAYSYNGVRFTSLQELKDYADIMEDATLIELIDIADSWGHNLTSIREFIRQHYACDAASADVVLSTIHKAKGMEWDRVALSEDIKPCPLAVPLLFVIECAENRWFVGCEPLQKAAIDRVHALFESNRNDSSTTSKRNDNSSSNNNSNCSDNNTISYSGSSSSTASNRIADHTSGHAVDTAEAERQQFITRYPALRLTSIHPQTYALGANLLSKKAVSASAAVAKCAVLCSCSGTCKDRLQQMFQFELQLRNQLGTMQHAQEITTTATVATSEYVDKCFVMGALWTADSNSKNFFGPFDADGAKATTVSVKTIAEEKQRIAEHDLSSDTIHTRNITVSNNNSSSNISNNSNNSSSGSGNSTGISQEMNALDVNVPLYNSQQRISSTESHTDVVTTTKDCINKNCHLSNLLTPALDSVLLCTPEERGSITDTNTPTSSCDLLNRCINREDEVDALLSTTALGSKRKRNVAVRFDDSDCDEEVHYGKKVINAAASVVQEENSLNATSVVTTGSLVTECNNNCSSGTSSSSRSGMMMIESANRTGTCLSNVSLPAFAVKFSSLQSAHEWYVAVSRAKYELRVNSCLARILQWEADDFGGLKEQLNRML